MQLQMTFDLELNGYTEEQFREDPTKAMRVLLDRALLFIGNAGLVMRDDVICTPMGQPIARLTGWPAPTIYGVEQ